ncbi:unnamed protein product [Adineta steineri]|nr:unnamed protein product [Adineta steineri]
MFHKLIHWIGLNINMINTDISVEIMSRGNMNFQYSELRKLVYFRELLVPFFSDLVNGHISFNGAGTSLLSKIARLHPQLYKRFDSVQMTRSLEAH